MMLHCLFIAHYDTFKNVSKFLFVVAQIPIAQDKQIVAKVPGERNFDIAAIKGSWEGCHSITATSLQIRSNGEESIFPIGPMEKWKYDPLRFLQNAFLQTGWVLDSVF